MTVTTLFDNFNARHSTHEEVAETFVSNADFFNIAKNNHTFVLGPRGCGKTTMFKMLTSAALRKWMPKDEKGLAVKNGIPFIAIYIPSDELWKDQLKSLTASVEDEPQLAKFIANALNCINILTNFCQSIQNHIHVLVGNDEKGKEFEYADELIDLWALEGCSSTLSAVKLGLGARRDKLMAKLNKYIFDKQFSKKPLLEFEDFYYADFIATTKNAMTAFENIYNQEKELKWALCFDELELVSKDFFEDILKKLRIAPANIVFKLSASPLTEFNHNIAQVFHDYEIVKMWPFSFAEEARYSTFCEEIAKQRIVSFREAKGLTEGAEIDFKKIFKNLDYSIKAFKAYDFKVDYTLGDEERFSLSWNVFKELSKHDGKLRNELIKRGSDPEDPLPTSKLHYDSFFRKTKEIAINRLLFTRYKNNMFFGAKSVKEFSIYHGKETIFKLCEGNPRFIMNIINDIFIKTEKYVDLNNLEFSPEDQANVVKSVSSRFNAMLNTYPTTVIFNQRYVDLQWLINKVGSYFDTEVNRGEFKINPANSFYFDPIHTNKEILKLVNIGVALGAFVKLDKTNDDLVKISESRFRLSYLLHPTFKLPIRLFGRVKLNTILLKNINLQQLKIDVNED